MKICSLNINVSSLTTTSLAVRPRLCEMVSAAACVPINYRCDEQENLDFPRLHGPVEIAATVLLTFDLSGS
jgi:hypothetical protein